METAACAARVSAKLAMPLTWRKPPSHGEGFTQRFSQRVFMSNGLRMPNGTRGPSTTSTRLI
jgi:hypothetical protein